MPFGTLRIAKPLCGIDKTNRMKKTLIIGLLSISTFFSFGQQSENHNNQADSARVFVSFIVETDGSITDVKIDKLECFKCSKTFKKNIKKLKDTKKMLNQVIDASKS